MYDEAKGVPQDRTEAVKWFKLVVDQGHARAQLNLGFAYQRGACELMCAAR
jgi:TPR repeat protein